MAYKLLKTGAQANVQIREYVCDDTSDINSLPNSDPFGSTVYVIATGEEYVKSSNNGYVKKTTGGGGSMITPYEVDGVFGQNENNKDTLSLDITAAELYDACNGGRMIKVISPETEGVVIIAITSISCIRITMNEQSIFQFYLTAGKPYGTRDLTATDPVLIEEM